MRMGYLSPRKRQDRQGRQQAGHYSFPHREGVGVMDGLHEDTLWCAKPTRGRYLRWVRS